MLFPLTNIALNILRDEIYDQKRVSLSVLRLDTVHNVVSGNKLYKLHFFLETASSQASEGIITFGGAYSNHLVATAFACKKAGLKGVAFVRGEQADSLSDTLKECMEYGMKLHFITRDQFNKKDSSGLLNDIESNYKNYLIVPEGGYHYLGAKGASLIMELINDDVTHICSAVGTATTAAGLLMGLKKDQQVIAVPVLKNLFDLEDRIEFLTKQKFTEQQLKIMPDYHFGGYAKKTSALLDFMNSTYQKHLIPTDFVYTGKMLYAISDAIKNDFFLPGSKIVCVHTGGLQGNRSLKAGTLVF